MDRIAALPAEYRSRLLDDVDRLAATYATQAGVVLPADPPPARVLRLVPLDA